MSSRKRDARIAGFLYLLQAIVAPINLMYVLPRIVVRGDAAATAANIRTSESLFRLGIASELFGQAVGVFILWALYRLLKDVDGLQARLMVMLGLVAASTTFINALNEIAAWVVVQNRDFLAGFTAAQVDGLAYFFLRMHGSGVMAVSIYWGLWLFPFGVLLFRSGFIPKILGVLIVINGVAYLVASFVYFLLPQYRFIAQYMLIPELGEPVIILWLVIMGARDQPSVVPAPSPA